MKSLLALLPVLLCSLPVAAQSQAVPLALCENGECRPVISKTTYFNRPAYLLTDGKSEAIVVPELGRVMRYGLVGGANLLWNSPTPQGLNWGWINYGGDKTWLAPQSSWKVLHDKNWPPDTAFDGTPHSAQVLSGGKLKLVSNTSPRSGIRLERVMFFNAQGEFTIEQTASKTSGAPVRVGLWSISQGVPGEAIYLPTSPTSAYKNDFLWLGPPALDKVASLPTGMLCVFPKPEGGGIKVGVDAPVAALASVKDGLAWLQKSAKPAGQYPDGAEGAGFPVELYVNGDAKAFYAELELLGPLQNLYKGMKTTHTVRWSLHPMPSKDAESPETRAAVAALLR